MPLFRAAFQRDSNSLLRFSIRNQVQVIFLYNFLSFSLKVTILLFFYLFFFSRFCCFFLLSYIDIVVTVASMISLFFLFCAILVSSKPSIYTIINVDETFSSFFSRCI